MLRDQPGLHKGDCGKDKAIMAKVYFPQYNKKTEADGKSILECIQELGIEFYSECGGKGLCGKCSVEVTDGLEGLTEKTQLEEKLIKEPDKRLACSACLNGNCDVYVKVPGLNQKILTDIFLDELESLPSVHKIFNRVFSSAKYLGRYNGRTYGLAADIGTTTVAISLVDLEKPEIISTAAFVNPQTKYGADVISRIEYDREHPGELQHILVKKINSVFGREDIYDIVIVGNSTMRDLFFGKDVQSLGKLPFESGTRNRPLRGYAPELGLNFSSFVYSPPLIGGHIGSDTTASLLASGMHRSSEICMLIDIGTNCEIVLGNRDYMAGVSCAAGPAFEGCGIECGTAGINGAIEDVRIVCKETSFNVEYKTINNAPPVGICGSGLISLISELLRNDLINSTGKFKTDKKRFEICGNAYITERDLSRLLLSKGAVSLGQKVLMGEMGIDKEKIDKVYLAGAFGNYIDIESAVRIGLLPDIDRERIVKIGNSALAGAILILASRNARKESERVAKRVRHIRLESIDGFAERFVDELYFG